MLTSVTSRFAVRFILIANGIIIITVLYINYKDTQPVIAKYAPDTVTDKGTVLVPQDLTNLETDNSTSFVKPLNTTRLVYTRVLKCASTETVNLIRLLKEINQFNVIGEFTVKIWWNESEEWLQKKVMKASSWPEPWLYIRHVYFIDFYRYGNSLERAIPMPDYFSIVRDPVSRVKSWYYYKKKLFNATRISLDECVERGSHECVPVHSQDKHNFVIISFFCGHDKFCLYPNKDSLAKAKSNVEKYYSVIGIQEDYLSFLQVLEYMHPNYFKGIVEKYNNLTRHKNVRGNSTNISEKTREALKQQLPLEYDFYYFVKQRFYDLKSKIKL